MSDSDREEVEALKRRLSELEAKTVAPPAAKHSAKGGGPSGCLIASLVTAGVVAVAAVVGSLPGGNQNHAPSTPEAPCDEGYSEGIVLLAQGKGLVRGQDVDPREGLVVLVSRTQWDRLTFDEQRELAAAYDCRIAGQGSHLTAVRFRVDRSGRDIYAADATQLLRLREQGLAMYPTQRPSR